MAVMGDAGKEGNNLNSLRKSVEKENIKSVIMPGDNLYKGSYSDVWDIWKEQGFQFDVVAIGNHNDGYQREMAYFAMPKEYFSVVKFGARFIVLNSDNVKNVNEQFAWLEKEISTVTEKLVFITYHHPTFTVTKSHNWEEKKDFQLRMRQFLKSYGSRVTALLIGHDHITTFLNFGDVPVILAGSGREARGASPVSYVEDGFHIQTQYLAEQTQFWASLEIMEGAEEAKVTAIRVSDQAKPCSARLRHGTMTLDGSCP